MMDVIVLSYWAVISMVAKKNQGKWQVFTRNWWTRNPEYPGGREPSPGSKHTIGYYDTEAEAIKVCLQYNLTHPPGPLSRKAEHDYIPTSAERRYRRNHPEISW